jgi:hypothetical protein
MVNHRSFTEKATEGQKVLRVLEQHRLIGCMEGDGNLSVDYKNHLWNDKRSLPIPDSGLLCWIDETSFIQIAPGIQRSQLGFR